MTDTPNDGTSKEEVTFGGLLEQARQGSDEAAWDLVELYGPHVLRTVRRTISQEIRGKFDSEDFAQAVWASFFAASRQFNAVTEPRQLVGLLTKMARNKVIDEVRRRMQTQKYSVQRERVISEFEEATPLESRDPTPSQFAIARERWVQLLQSQPERDRQIIRLRLMGKTNRSIAQELQISERTVRRVIDRMTELNLEKPDEE